MNRKYQISDWMLEKHLVNELDAKTLKKVLAALKTNQDSVVERLQELQNSNFDILQRFPKMRITDQIQAKLNQNRVESSFSAFDIFIGKAKQFVIGFKSNHFAYAALVMFLCFPGYFTYNHWSEQTRLKGIEPHLTVYRKTGDSFEKLEDQGVAKTHDLLQVSYFTLGLSYGVILSIDGRGSVTVHLPSATNSAALLISQKEVVLPTAFELDDAPHFDQFYFFTSHQPFLIRPIIEAIKSAKQANLNSSLVKGISSEIKQYTFTLRK